MAPMRGVPMRAATLRAVGDVRLPRRALLDALILPALVGLNPLLRFGGFEAKAQGIKMMLPHVDEFRPVHNLSSIQELITTLSRPLPPHHRSLIRSAA